MIIRTKRKTYRWSPPAWMQFIALVTVTLLLSSIATGIELQG